MTEEDIDVSYEIRVAPGAAAPIQNRRIGKYAN